MDKELINLKQEFDKYLKTYLDSEDFKNLVQNKAKEIVECMKSDTPNETK